MAESTHNLFAFKRRRYYAKKLCVEPTSVTVKAEGVRKNAPPEFGRTNLLSRLTCTFVFIEGHFKVSMDGWNCQIRRQKTVAAVTVQLSDGECVPSLFTIKQLVASEKPENFGGRWRLSRSIVHPFWIQKEGPVQLVAAMRWCSSPVE
ncbi:hypothetical protein V6N13_021338 [Hibiscus sabdariffa]